MSFHYNLYFLSGNTHFSVFDLEREHILAGSTCNALYHQKAVQTSTLEKILNHTGCSLQDFLSYRSDKTTGSAKRSIDLNDMVRRSVISRTARRHFLEGLPMSLGTLNTIAEDQEVNLLDFLKIEVKEALDEWGNLKNNKKVLYLTEW